ncbi:uncharacterized protein BP5553_05197 [Venustampulla echinocandica]|uniref:Uncharacterized protein n=1 Tax=Venustampulla echinocandica TaxID=2656787 RepID=A0A370TQH4_9HELO|nr:uncharacterized protein BP5553_05197 [Venustampulla echinocandica]RDL37764.1 hypothetical protein BP5553_05197 [Venustampulla echinocandica]
MNAYGAINENDSSGFAARPEAAPDGAVPLPLAACMGIGSQARPGAGGPSTPEHELAEDAAAVIRWKGAGSGF